MGKIKIGGACLNQIPMDWEGNLINIKAAIIHAKKQEIEILCLPELCITGYGCEDMFLSNWLPETAFEKLLEIVPICENILVTIGLPIRLGSKVYNTTCIVINKEIHGFYAKNHLANDGVHYETRWFTSWQQEVETKITISGKDYKFGSFLVPYQNELIGFEICEDAWRIDRPAIHWLAKEATIIMNPSASHFAFGKADFRKNLVTTSSQKFNCTYLYCNLLGNESGRMIFDGDIMIAKKGKMLALNRRLSFQNYNLVYLDVDTRSAEIELSTSFQNDLNGNYEEFGNCVALALFDYMRKCRSKGFILSLSGGADSSSIAVLVAEMVKIGLKELGLVNFTKKLNLEIQTSATDLTNLSFQDQCKYLVGKVLHTAYQGTVNSSDKTEKSAKELARSIGAKFSNWKIDEQVAQNTTTIETALGRKLRWETDDIALQNIQARTRSPLIWMLANIENKLLLTTSNRSEGSVGYTTMDGDTSGSISPIAGINKSFLLQWLIFAEKNLGYSGLKYVNNLAPSAELRPLEKEQTDESDLMPYELLNSIEQLAIRDRLSPIEVFTKLETRTNLTKTVLADYITKFFKLWSINQWKRERLAPSFHLDEYNVDSRTWCRFPILSSAYQEELKKLNELALTY
jgi:NAD+ synthase (glutamine-hydrolysing)